MAHISELLSVEEVMQKQQSRADRLKDGDHNTSFFQAMSRERSKHNKVISLKQEDGSVPVSQEELEGCVTSLMR
jgi:hypothetical protein